jgi:HK97 family phage portal protein
LNIIQKAAWRLVKNEADSYISRFLRGESVSGTGSPNMDSETALKYSAVFACCRVLAETFASVPFILYKKDQKQKEREPTTDLPIYDILHYQPNSEMSPFSCKEAWMMAMNLGGNAVSERLVNSAGELVGLYPYPWEMVTIDRDKTTNQLIYKISSGTQQKVLRRDQVFHVPGPSLDGVHGLSPISYAASSIRLGLTYEQFGVNFFKNGANPSGAFKSPGELSETAYNRLKDQLDKKYTGQQNAGHPMLLEGGLEWIPYTVNPTDAQLLESKSFQIEDICRIYRVPQHLVNKLDRSTNNNIEHQSLEFVVYTMLPIFKRHEEAINMQLLTPAQRAQGYFIEAKMDGLMRGDSAARSAFYASGRQWGWLCVNDIRKLENLPAVKGGNVFLQPSNMIEAGSSQENAVNAKVLQEISDILKERSNAN